LSGNNKKGNPLSENTGGGSETMKKQGVILLAVMLMLTGCSGQASSKNAGESQNPAVSEADASDQGEMTQDAEQTASEEPSEDDPAAEEAAPADEVAPNDLGLRIQKDSQMEWEGSITLSTVAYETIQIDQNRFPELAKQIDIYNENLLRECQEWKTDFTEYAREAYTGSNSFYGYEMNRSINMYRADASVFSFRENYSDYTGGAHGNYGCTGYNFDSVTGKQLTLDDVLLEKSKVAELVIEQLKQDNGYDTNSLFDEGFEDTIRQEFGLNGGEESLSWTLGYGDFHVYFDPYEISYYAAGSFSVAIPLAEHSELFAPICMNKPASYVFQVPLDEKIYVELSDDGKAEPLCISAQNSADIYAYELCQLSITKDDQGGYWQNLNDTIIKAWIVKLANGKTFLYVKTIGDSDFACLHRFDITGGSINYLDYYPEAPSDYSITDPANFCLETHCDVLSTYGVSRRYSIGDDGEISANDELYTVTQYDDGFRRDLVSRTVVKAPEIAPDGTVGAEEEIPAGTTFHFYQTDGATFADMKLDNGKIYRIYTDINTWPHTVNGQPEDEIFDGIGYAG
jgi:hypothetical protein